MRVFRKLLKVLACILSVGIVGIGLALLVLRYYVSPRIEQWRPEIVQWGKEHITPELDIAHVQLAWQGIRPVLQLQEVSFASESNQHKDSTLPKNSIASLEIGLGFPAWVDFVRVKQANVLVERNALGEVVVAGQKLSAQGTPVIAHSPQQEQELPQLLKSWIGFAVGSLPQHIDVQESQVIWRDHYQQVRQDLIFSPTSLHVENTRHAVKLDFSISPPKQAGSALQLSAQLNTQGKGQAYITLTDWYPQYFKQWLYFPLVMKAGVVEKAHASLQFEQFSLKQFTSHTALKDFIFEGKDNTDFSLQGEHVELDVSSQTGLSHPYQFDVHLDKFVAYAQDFFRHAVEIDDLHLKGHYTLNQFQQAKLDFSTFEAALPYGQLSLTGSWEVDPKSDNGLIDIQGSIQHMQLGKIPSYLPKSINSESLDWLEQAFKSGVLENAKVKVKGVVDHIPYGIHAESGDFQIEGPVTDVVLHYHQKKARENKYWPDVVAHQAYVHFNRDTIHVRGDNLEFDPALALKDFKISLANVDVKQIEKNALVDIKAKLDTSGEDLLSFYHQTPLQPILSHGLDQTAISGRFVGDIAVQIPIMHAEDAVIKSTLQAQNASFQFTPDHPPLTQANGEVLITEKHVELHNLQGQLLGGDSTVDGSVGSAGDELTLQGELTSEGLYNYLPMPGIKQRVKGKTTYQASIRFLGGKALEATISSSLKGLALHLPAGLDKSAAETKKLQIELSTPQHAKTERLSIRYPALHAVFVRPTQSKSGFVRGALALHKPLSEQALPERGLAIDAQLDDVDVMTWLDFVDEFTLAKSQGITLFPHLRQLKLNAQRLSLFDAYIDNVLLQAERETSPEKDAAIPWQLQFASDDAHGRVNLWLSPQQAKVDTIELAMSRFKLKRLKTEQQALLEKGAAVQETPSVSAEEEQDKPAHRVDLPSIRGNIKSFYLDKQALGELAIQSQSLDKDRWQLSSLSLSNGVGSLYATGMLSSESDRTKANIQLNINALDTGAFLHYFDVAKNLNAAQGFINAHLESDDVSNLALRNIRLSGDFQMHHGAFLQVNSTAMKALAVVSLQSLSSLKQVGSQTPGVLSKGLAFDYLRGSFAIKQGNLQLRDFRLNGPLVAVVAAGESDLIKEQLDIHAAAIPKLDMSGAAVLAGVIVNPAVGVGAFLSQWLLSAPLNRALTSYFHVTGSWDNPLVNDQPLPEEKDLQKNSK